jgi:hypothetical protein
VKPLKAIASGVLASHLAGETLHIGHAHPALPVPAPSAAHAGSPSHNPLVHVPDEQSSFTPTKAEAAAGIVTGRTLGIFTGRAPSKKSDPNSGIRLATLRPYTSTDPETLGHVWADGTADLSGTAGHFRVMDDASEVVFQGDITIPGGGGDLTFENTIVVAGGTVVISAGLPCETQPCA